jgi:hypothetical protein
MSFAWQHCTDLEEEEEEMEREFPPLVWQVRRGGMGRRLGDWDGHPMSV